MAIHNRCPSCQNKLPPSDVFAGRILFCPLCGFRLDEVVTNEFRPEDLQPTTAISMRDTDPAAGWNADQTFAAVSGSRRSDSEADASEDLLFSSVSRMRCPADEAISAAELRSQNRLIVAGVPLIALMLLAGGVSFLLTRQLPDLHGKMSAAVVAETVLPPLLLPWSGTGLSEGDRALLTSEWREAQPVDVSAGAICSVRAAESGLVFELEASRGFCWYRITPTDHAALTLWRKKKQILLNSSRVAELQQSLAASCATLRTAFDHAAQNLSEHSSPVNGSQRKRKIADELHSEHVGINPQVRGLGSALEAVNGTYVTRCLREDEQGELFFLMPTGVTGFTVRGRTLPDKGTLFPGIYDVEIKKHIAGPDSTVSKPADDLHPSPAPNSALNMAPGTP